jgi:hypothetical protein
VPYVTLRGRPITDHAAMPRPLNCIAGVVAAAALAASVATAQASAPSRHLVYGCGFSQIWLTPGHHPIGFLNREQPFDVSRYSTSGRWAFGTSGFPGQRLRSHGWVRRSALCRTRVA